MSAHSETSDFDKLRVAFSSFLAINSFDDVLAAFGLRDLPTAQKYGIVGGIVVFTLTISSVMALLVFGGTFKRISEQEDTGDATLPNAVAARRGRPLLLERLLEARERMINNYKKDSGKHKFTVLTRMLNNVSPDFKFLKSAPVLLDESEEAKKEQAELMKKYVPRGYEDNYISAYKICQAKIGGKVLSGLPEARFEAYARGFAGCGIDTNTNYRRSYARLYESLCCGTHGLEKKYSQIFIDRPHDIVGRTCRLEALEAERHAERIFQITNGDAFGENNGYDADEVWGFSECGPFETKEELASSTIFNLEKNEAAFAIIENVTNKIIGCVHLTNDNPKDLNIQLEPPIMKPSSHGTAEQVEACFLLLDKLFAVGYRRIQISIDCQNTEARKMPSRLGFTQEGMIPKDRILKDSSRDSIIYGLLNSDWDKGARSFMFKKLHGAKMQSADDANNARESELEEQDIQLKAKRAAEAEQENKAGKK